MCRNNYTMPNFTTILKEIISHIRFGYLGDVFELWGFVTVDHTDWEHCGEVGHFSTNAERLLLGVNNVGVLELLEDPNEKRGPS